MKSEFKVGNVIVATGYKEFDASRVTHYGYGKLPNVITSFEFEKMLRAGRIQTKEGKDPQYVAIIHCVGSRSKEFHTYCSRVCCMTALKYSHEVKSALPKCYVSDVYIDMHAFGKGHEDFYRGTSEAKTLFLMYGKNDYPVIRKAGPKDDCEMLIEVNEKLSGEIIEIPADLVILMVGMEAREDSEAVARLVNISRDKDGWFIESHPEARSGGHHDRGHLHRRGVRGAQRHPRLGSAGPGRGRPDPGPHHPRHHRHRRGVRRGRRGEVLRLPGVQRALPLFGDRVRLGEEA